MKNHLFMEERRRLIMETLRDQGRVSVSELSSSMSVSTVTIRQDLRALEGEGLLERTHGGAVEVQPGRTSDEPELSFDIRRTKQIEEKAAIGKAAAAMIETGSAIALDASTTVCGLIPYFTRLDSLTVVTNNLMVTELLMTNPRVDVLLPAGRLRRDAYSIIGDPDTLPQINLNIGFVSAWGVSLEAGMTEVNEDETRLKRAMLSRCIKKILLVDSTKWGQVAPYTYGIPEDFDLIITTNRVSESQLKDFDKRRILQVEV